jgi:hypothetical protein
VAFFNSVEGYKEYAITSSIEEVLAKDENWRRKEQEKEQYGEKRSYLYDMVNGGKKISYAQVTAITGKDLASSPLAY